MFKFLHQNVVNGVLNQYLQSVSKKKIIRLPVTLLPKQSSNYRKWTCADSNNIAGTIDYFFLCAFLIEHIKSTNPVNQVRKNQGRTERMRGLLDF
jgi:hypothetical protein